MNREAIEAWVETHLKALMQELGVSHWHVYIGIERLEQPEDGHHTVHMLCIPDSDCWLATIRIDPEHNDDEKQFVENLTHELLGTAPEITSSGDARVCCCDQCSPGSAIAEG